jgi:hypothetical protein
MEDNVKSHTRQLTTEDLQKLNRFTEHDSGEKNNKTAT